MASTARQPGAVTSADAPAPPRTDQRLRRVWDAVERPDIRVISSDVFDTIVWRQVPEPVDAFTLVAARLRDAGMLARELEPEAFVRVRVAAEEHARRARMGEAGQSEVTLTEIYSSIPRWLLGHVKPSHAMEVELEVEREILVPDLDVVAVLLAAAEAGKRVIAVSDTYFSEAQLRRLLRQPVLSQLRFDRVFTSSDHRTNKSGGLFGIALNAVDVRPEEVVHLGDNPEADLHYPGELGIECHLFERRPEVLTKLLAAEARFRGPARPAVAAAAIDVTALRGKVATREERALMPSALRELWEFGALVAGPVFTGFAEWLVERAAEIGVTEVHCFMREGDFLGELLDRAGEYTGTGIRSRKLWLNRAVLAPAAIATAAPHELAPLLVRRRTPTVAGLLAAVGLGFADLPRFAGHEHTRLDDPTTRDNLLAAIAADDAARAKVVEHARRVRERVVRLVEPSIDENGMVALADLGWGASAQGLLRQALDQAGAGCHLAGFYLATHVGAAQRVLEGMIVRGYLAEFGAPKEALDLVVRSPEVLEQICMPDHGSQVGLTDDLEPVLEPGEARGRLQAVEADAVRKGIRAFQREWARYRTVLPGKLGPLSGSGRDVVRPLLVRAVASPTEREATLFGGWMHDENQGSTATEAVIDPRRVERLRHVDPAGLRDLPMEELYWPFGVAAQIDASWADLMTAAAAGEIGWDALSGPVDTGPFRVRVEEGTAVPAGALIDTVPVRNRFGLSAVTGSLRAPGIRRIALEPCDRPAVLRIDFLELRCHTQGREEPIELRFEAPASFARIERANCFVLNPNVFVVPQGSPALRIDLAAEIPAPVFRVDVSCGFAIIALGELVPTAGRLRNVEEAGVRVDHLERVLADMKGSASWKLTRPLRMAKRLGGS